MHRVLAAWLMLGVTGAAACAAMQVRAEAATDATGDALIGRWDIAIHTPDGDQPSWLEVRRSGSRTLVGQFVGVVGSARPISQVHGDDDAMHFSIPPQWESGASEMTFTGKRDGDGWAGAMTFPDGKRFDWNAHRAPSLQRAAIPTWGTPIHLFNGKDLAGWHALGGTSRWEVAGGELRNSTGGANLATMRTFTDFKLHLEVKVPPGSNSGIYLRGRHEVQIEDGEGVASLDSIGAVYGFLAPSENAARPAGVWQSLDITLVGRYVSVVLNGRSIICDREIPGITGGALDSDEGAPGSLVLQGDHGPVAFRNILLTPSR